MAQKSEQVEHWSSEKYQNAASFVPKLATKVLGWLNVQKDDVILDVGCGVLDGTALSQKPELQNASFDKVFSNAAMHWILSPEATRETFFRGIHAALKPSGTFVFEMGGMGNVAEMRTALFFSVSRRIGLPAALAVDPWFFPDEIWMTKMLEETVGGFKVEKIEREYRPTKADEGGIEAWIRLMGKQFFDVVKEEVLVVVTASPNIETTSHRTVKQQKNSKQIMAQTQEPPQQKEWWEAFPAPKAKCDEVTAEEVMGYFDDMDLKPSPREFLLVDVRRTDWEGGTIKTSLNLPAQSFYQARKTLLDLCERASIKKVIFYCGASNGRGPRCANWMQDYITDVSKFGHKSSVKVLVLKGGIKGWVREFEGSMMESFEEEYWKQFMTYRAPANITSSFGHQRLDMMKSAFGSKRRARKIQVDDDEDGGARDETENNSPVIVAPNSNRKGFKKSHLRQSIAFDDLQQDEDDTGASSKGGSNGSQNTNKATIGRSNSLMKKKKPASSRLSFGPGEIISGDAAETLGDDEAFTPKKPTLGRRVIEGNALRKSLPYQGLPIRSGDDDEERPTYSKDYLNELKSSTPTTPKDLQALHATAEDEEGLDASELEGAMIVDTETSTTAPSHIPTEAEIREKKERRARLAQEKDFISFDDVDEVDDNDRREISILPRKKHAETRLVREDEDLGEGFDEFVDDGRVALGKKQEREAKRRHRKEIADMIQKAEGSSEENSDDSEAERRAAYEAAQTRAGMDGLHKPGDNEETAATQIPSKITPLPVLSECLERLQATLSTMQQELARKHKRVADLEKEKRQISTRETEVQDLLTQAGARYAALKAGSSGVVADPKLLVEATTSGLSEAMIVDRGLESFGNTPTVRPDVEDVG
ncbi:hypothetical protein G7Y89_g3080 [Cudoniella acicularis]|uniref:Rhodanese domain-containing protein n=1 Tax=Cudoniella acicularis TaxID=354080 RepID=A0A8H4RTX8_9HELO|nr:hypothetical protein G7Y89_g3080 [Cudoniella acicularis]